MTMNHIDQLAECWENAEQGEAEPGDWIITHGPDDTNPAYIIEQAPRYPLSSKRQPYRILARATKPKPAWHDAVAVMADDGDGGRMVWVRIDEQGEAWESADGFIRHSRELNNVTPLVEAKVTDEARDRAWDELVHHGLIDPQKHRPSQGWTADVVHAALGLETK